jgi:hypothetical protein
LELDLSTVLRAGWREKCRKEKIDFRTAFVTFQVTPVLNWDGFESKLDRLIRNRLSFNWKEELRFWVGGGTSQLS